MPQLDILSFSSELIWFLLLFFSSFFLFLLYILPNVYAVLRIREKRRHTLSSFVQSSDLNTKILDTYSGNTSLDIASSDPYKIVSLEPKNSFNLGYTLFFTILSEIDNQRLMANSALALSYYSFMVEEFEEDLDDLKLFVDHYYNDVPSIDS